jgi:hypothetical protein
MDLERQKRFRKISFRISKLTYFVGSLFLVSMGTYFICNPFPLTTVEQRVINFLFCSVTGVCVFIALLICVFGDYEEKQP